jgi:hypothetical protein
MTMAFTRPMTWIPPVAAAGAGAISAAAAARMFLGPGATPPMSYLVEGGVGVLGWPLLLASGMVRPVTAFSFFVGATVPIVSDMFSRYIFRAMGLSAYAYDTAAELAEMGQEPRFPPSLSDVGAYAYELQGADEEAMGDLATAPYGGTYAGYGGAMPRAPWETAGVAGAW